MNNKYSEQQKNKIQWLNQYHAAIIIPKFTIKYIQTYGTYSQLQLANIQTDCISVQKLKQLITNQLKLCYLLDPLLRALQLYEHQLYQCYSLKLILKALIQGQFYRYLPKTQSRLLVNNRTTQMNVKIIIAGVILYGSKRLNLNQIADTVLLFTLQQSIFQTSPHGLPVDANKILNIINKLQRNIKYQNIKIWLDELKYKQPYINELKHIQLDQFLYLVGISTKNKIKNGLFFQNRVNYQNNFNNLKSQQNIISKSIKKNIQIQQKVKGISFYYNQNKPNKSQQLYQQIKRTLSLNIRPRSSLLTQQINKLHNQKKKLGNSNKILIKKKIPIQNNFWNNISIKTKNQPKNNNNYTKFKQNKFRKNLQICKNNNYIMKKIYQNQLKTYKKNKIIDVNQFGQHI